MAYRYEVKRTQHVARPFAILDCKLRRYVGRFTTHADAHGRCCDLNRYEHGEQIGARPIRFG